jgi:hypothetical protein
MKQVRQWREVVANTESAPGVTDDQIDKSQLHSVAVSIASSSEKRELLNEKRKLSANVVTAASTALTSLNSVLEFEGGWLLTEDESDDGTDESRRSELQTLRSKLLPDLVMQYYEVCEETSSWLVASLDDAMERLGEKSRADALATLDDSCDGVSSTLSPKCWTDRALALAGQVASDAYSIKTACSAANWKDLLDKLAEVTVLGLCYSE